MPEPHEFEPEEEKWRCDICGQYISGPLSADSVNYCFNCYWKN